MLKNNDYGMKKVVDKMSTASIGRISGVAVTINKGADDKAQPQRV
jgi:hypothetical protein